MAHFLVIDDDANFRGMLSAVLQNEHFVVREASSAKAALEILKNDYISFVITDIVMPDMDGLELIMAIKESWPETPVIAMSGGAEFLPPDRLLKVAEKLGACRILQKPFQITELLDKVYSVVS